MRSNFDTLAAAKSGLQHLPQSHPAGSRHRGKWTTNRLLYGLTVCLAIVLLGGCASSTSLPTPPAPTASPLPPAFILDTTAETLPALVVAEREASIQGNLPLLASLWAEDGEIIDGRGSIEETDDYRWQGRAAILDRYRMAVFPAPPPPLTLADLADATLTVDGDTAALLNNGDRWQFTQREGRWWLQTLVYSAPTTQ